MQKGILHQVHALEYLDAQVEKSNIVKQRFPLQDLGIVVGDFVVLSAHMHNVAYGQVTRIAVRNDSEKCRLQVTPLV